ncbi:hypothetical protein HID58_050737 [Brassica napus]|uniref:Uncharacterized protein n=1 Tax=Brassica napus TaxID=3708 RepID=A0ABQ8A7U6_BRANA|nr:hypothetical protein HID58_050737 [Brassica napus]
MDFFKSKYRSYDSKENQGEEHEAFFFFFVSLNKFFSIYFDFHLRSKTSLCDDLIIFSTHFIFGAFSMKSSVLKEKDEMLRGGG